LPLAAGCVGTYKAHFGVFEPIKGPASNGPTFAVTILGNSLSIPQYQQPLLLPATQQGSGSAAAADAGSAAAADGIVVVNALTGITLTVSLADLTLACAAAQASTDLL
jgi:hypothetical protein